MYVMISRQLKGLCFLLFLSSCAQVPESSVTLSQSIGKDIQSMYIAHTRFVDAYFDELERKRNKFIDDIYTPAVISKSIQKDLEDAKDKNSQGDSALFWIQTAYLNTDGLTKKEVDDAQAAALGAMEVFHTTIYEQIEDKRTSLLVGTQAKRHSLQEALQANYQNIIRKNASISGLLLSVVEVHNSQEEVLMKLDIDPDLRQNLGGSLADISDKLEDFGKDVSDKNYQFDELDEKLKSFSEKIFK
jgi:hypothetical protein